MKDEREAFSGGEAFENHHESQADGVRQECFLLGIGGAAVLRRRG